MDSSAIAGIGTAAVTLVTAGFTYLRSVSTRVSKAELEHRKMLAAFELRCREENQKAIERIQFLEDRDHKNQQTLLERSIDANREIARAISHLADRLAVPLVTPPEGNPAHKPPAHTTDPNGH
jgi:hypothetical protein